MSSPHGSLFCSHWKCVAVVCEVNRIERFRRRWKEEGKKPRCWNHQSGCCRAAFSFFLVLPSCHRLSLLSSFHPFFSFYPLISYPPFCVLLLLLFLTSFLKFCFIASLDRHVQSHHGHHKPFRCKLCPFKSAYVSRLKSHLHKAHTGK